MCDKHHCEDCAQDGTCTCHSQPEKRTVNNTVHLTVEMVDNMLVGLANACQRAEKDAKKRLPFITKCIVFITRARGISPMLLTAELAKFMDNTYARWGVPRAAKTCPVLTSQVFGPDFVQRQLMRIGPNHNRGVAEALNSPPSMFLEWFLTALFKELKEDVDQPYLIQQLYAAVAEEQHGPDSDHLGVPSKYARKAIKYLYRSVYHPVLPEVAKFGRAVMSNKDSTSHSDMLFEELGRLEKVLNNPLLRRGMPRR